MQSEVVNANRGSCGYNRVLRISVYPDSHLPLTRVSKGYFRDIDPLPSSLLIASLLSRQSASRAAAFARS